MSVSKIDARWFLERGGLHDAEVTSARLVESSIVIAIDDEWANERGLSWPADQKLPVSLTFVSGNVLEGNLSEATGGWISELLWQGEGRFRFVFCDRDILVIEASSVLCEAAA